MSGKGSIVWNDNFLHTQYSLLSVGDNFRDDIGFVKRTGIRKHFVDFGVRPRPAALRKYGIRELHPHTRYNIYTDQSNVKVTHTNHVAMSVFFENGANVEFAVEPALRADRRRRSGSGRISRSRRGSTAGTNTTCWSRRTTAGWCRRRSISPPAGSGRERSGRRSSGVIVRPSYHLTFDLALQRNDIDLPFPMHAFVTNLVTSRIGYAFSTRTFLDTLLQYNTDLKQLSANVRFDLIHRPLSDLFVVYNEQRLTDQPTPVNTGRGLIVKYTHMLAF